MAIGAFGKSLGDTASRLVLALGLAASVASSSQAQQAAGQIQMGTSFDCSRTGQNVPSLVCQTPELRLADLQQMQAYYTLRHALPERHQELRNQFVARIQALVRECSTDQVRLGGSQSACVARALADLRSFWLQQVQQTANPSALEETRQTVAALEEAQRALRVRGFLPADAVLDGVYGSGTRQAISRFQTERGIPANGFLTSATASALRAASAPSAPSAPSAVISLPRQQQVASPQTQGAARDERSNLDVDFSRDNLPRPRSTNEGVSLSEQRQISAARASNFWNHYNSRPKTILEQVFNYTTFANEEHAPDPRFFWSGLRGAAWISNFHRDHKCVMSLVGIGQGRGNTAEIYIMQEIDIRQLNQTGFRIQPYVQEGINLFGSSIITSGISVGDGITFIQRDNLNPNISVDRLARAWGLAFRECPGRRSAF